LMVAITVILAAVIAAFVFGMTGNVQTTKSVGATVSQSGTAITLVYQGGPDASVVTGINWTIDGIEQDPLNDSSNGTLKVGTSRTNVSAGTTGRDHVVAVVFFQDGSSQVILDTYV
ncbi:MAG: type IV pilin N-terminal domain-containing protein, partial [Methanomicrobiales archaeon]|nr:type IV pilin N-terminal domain-containing protein [Methanomicrobiales archaeon]